MARIVLLQLVTALVAALLAALLGGRTVGISSLLGGLSCVLPNALFAFGLHVSERKLHTGTLTPFFFWELVKVSLTIACVVAVFWLYEDVSWLAFLVSLIVVLKSYIFLLSQSKN